MFLFQKTHIYRHICLLIKVPSYNNARDLLLSIEGGKEEDKEENDDDVDE